ncbi:HAMP domain-containing histidine kinase [Candidatus Parcubacteria bacterium]|nr:HAMP domain-containing histidine kinase [Candidatus Parcubacteria bacterium]
MKAKNFFIQNRMVAQIAYGVFLIVLIPLLITFNTVFIISKYNQTLDVTLQKQALSTGRTIAALIENDLPWSDFIQIKIEALIKNNIAIEAIDVLIPEENGDNFKIIASSDKESIGETNDFYFYKLAWLQPKNDGLATDSFGKFGENQEIDATEDRFWLVAMPMVGNDGNKQALISIKISSEIIDSLTNYNRNVSIFILVGTVIIVIMFLLVAVRLWDYALLYKKIKEVDKMKDEFIAIASHELRTPVTGIRGFTSMIVDGTLGKVNDKVKKSALMIQRESERLAILVEDLLNVSRIEQNRVKMNLRPADAKHIINEVIENLSVQAEKKKLHLDFKSRTRILPMINVDVDRLKQILINLIGNAIKYTEKGGIEIITKEKNNASTLEIIIKDTGIGMSSKERERLFEKFYRIQNDKTKHVTGTGLGLWITKKFVELMGGEITIDSIEGVGTQISLLFPIVKS